MRHILNLSRTFPAYHPKAGQPTFFVEKVYNSLYREPHGDWSAAIDPDGTNTRYVVEDLDQRVREIKHHTIRAIPKRGKFKAGDTVSLRVWSGKPYASKQIIIAPDIEVKKVWDFEMIGINWDTEHSEIMMTIDGQERLNPVLLASNDGLTYDDFYRWFTLSPHFKKTKTFEGQIIAWGDVNY